MTEFIALIREIGLPLALFAILALSLARARDSQTRRDNAFSWQFVEQAKEIRKLRETVDMQRDRISELTGKLEEERRTCLDHIEELQHQINQLKLKGGSTHETLED
jgi:predicted RNase H-like nuclease (RuvC/YqgF family)